MSELLFLHKRSSLSTLAGSEGEWKHDQVFKSFAYYFVFAHANDFTSGSLCVLCLTLCSALLNIFFFFIKKKKGQVQSWARSNNM